MPPVDHRRPAPVLNETALNETATGGAR